jgi:NAD(P)H-hydrate epimerase
MNYPTLNQNCLKKVYRRRQNWSHKGDFGKILVIGGSLEYSGSPALVALAALRTGADMVKIIAPRRAADICASFSPELISIPFQKDHLDSEAVGLIKKNSDWANVIEIGSGIGKDYNQSQLVNSIIKDLDKKTVLDADALKVLNKDLLDHNILITPNTYEFNKLFGTVLSNNVEDRLKLVKEKAKEYETTILLKGHIDIISNGEDHFINKTNSVYMTKGGTGDVLTGICAGLIGQGNSIIDSACAATFINGYTGRVVARLKREALSPMDLIENISSTITKWRYQ